MPPSPARRRNKRPATWADRAQYCALLCAGQSCAVWGQLRYTGHPTWTGMLARGLPFAWLDWTCMFFALSLMDRVDLVRPMQHVMCITVLQLSLGLLLTHRVLRLQVRAREVLACALAAFGVWVSLAGLPACAGAAAPAPAPARAPADGAERAAADDAALAGAGADAEANVAATA